MRNRRNCSVRLRKPAVSAQFSKKLCVTVRRNRGFSAKIAEKAAELVKQRARICGFLLNISRKLRTNV